MPINWPFACDGRTTFASSTTTSWYNITKYFSTIETKVQLISMQILRLFHYCNLMFVVDLKALTNPNQGTLNSTITVLTYINNY